MRFISLLSPLLFSLCFALQAQEIYTIYGTVDVTEPVILELLESDGLCRLKDVHQYGICHYIIQNKIPYSRYTHSVGVFALLRMYGAPLSQQIAGLLHDVSHTVFSHVGDHVLAQLNKKNINQNDEALQDTKHQWLLSQTDIPAILNKYGLTLSDVDHTSGGHTMLKCPYPDICVDRLEYNLYGGYIEEILTEDDIQKIISHLHYQDGSWIFNDPEAAHQLATTSLYLCEHIFSCEWNIGAYEWTAKALLHAVDNHLLSMNDIYFGRDDQMLSFLTASDDATICNAINNALHAKTTCVPTDKQHADISYTGKCRILDPWICTKHGLQRLSAYNTSFACRLAQAKQQIEQTRYVRYAVEH